MSPTNPSELKRVIARTKIKLSPGLDQIPSVILKHVPQNILEVFIHIFNQSLLNVKFISAFKKAKKVSIFKNGNQPQVHG